MLIRNKVSVLSLAFCGLFSLNSMAQTAPTSGSYYFSEDYEAEVIIPANKYTSTNPENKKVYTSRRENHSVSDSWEEDYSNWKKALTRDTGLSYSVDVSVLGQRAAPSGKGTSLQFQAYPNLSWQLFNNEYGSGILNAAYTPNRYWNSTTGDDISTRIGVLSAINDYSTKSNSFNQLSYTQNFKGDLDWFGITVGQFPLSNFDGTNYDSNQQVNFVNYALSQNASSTYPTASLGAYLTFTLTPEWQIITGMQDANNISGTSISSSDFGKGEFTSFASLLYSPTIANLGGGQYSILVYNQPSVREQRGTSTGWSLNFEQNITDAYAVFARVNGAKDSPSQIEQSYVVGSVINNPLNRNALDQIGIALAVNKANKDVIGHTNTRSYETVMETYWALGVKNWLTITPDFQVYFYPALDNRHDTAFVSSLRTTFMF